MTRMRVLNISFLLIESTKLVFGSGGYTSASADQMVSV
jgi:hypothetical protein